MKVLTANQIREADRATIEREPISSLDLMERAATGIARWISANIAPSCRLLFCCGRGGNGGDGLAAARILATSGRDCMVILATSPEVLATSPSAPASLSDVLAADTRSNLARLPQGVKVYDISVERPDIEPDTVIIDALLGAGVSGEVRGPVRGVIEWINSLSNRVISIDIPSGMPTETVPQTPAPVIVRAWTTLAIEFPKLAMLLPETGEYAGTVVVIPIGLDEKFVAAAATPYYYITEEWVAGLRKPPRAKFSHKGTYGHALLVCGSAAMPGAAVLATGGTLRSGCGLVTAHISENERFALIANHPSAMLSLDADDCFSTLPDSLERFSAVGVGPGLGRALKTVEALGKLLAAASSAPSARSTSSASSTPSASGMPLVLDADALNIIAEYPEYQHYISADSILTPHPGELRRLVGEWRTDREKLEKASKFAHKTRSVVIVKGSHSVVCTPDGRFLFNSTGTPGMAKGGSGDVLTGLLTGLLARGYDAATASVIGVYIHGRAGERAAQQRGEEAMNASDLAAFL